MGLQLVLPVLPVRWQFSEVWDRLQARGRDWDGVLPRGHGAQRWSGVGRSVNAPSQASLGCEPSLPQLLVEPIVCRGSCERKQGLSERARSGWQGPWRFPPGQCYRGPQLAVPWRGEACRWGLLPVYSGGTRHCWRSLRKASPSTWLRSVSLAPRELSPPPPTPRREESTTSL